MQTPLAATVLLWVAVAVLLEAATEKVAESLCSLC